MITPLMIHSLTLTFILYSYIWKRPITFNRKEKQFNVISNYVDLRIWYFLVFFFLPLTVIFPIATSGLLLRWGLVEFTLVQKVCGSLWVALALIVLSCELILRRFGEYISIAYRSLKTLHKRFIYGKHWLLIF